MRKPFALVLLVAFSWVGGLAHDARAGVTIDVVFQDAMVPSGISIVPGDPGPGCVFTGYYHRTVSTGRCMDVILTTTDEWIGMGTSVTYDTGNGLALASMKEWRGVGVSFNKSGTLQKACLPPAGLTDLGGVIQSFDCIVAPPNDPPAVAAGTYRIGTLVWDTSGHTLGVSLIAAYINPLIDGFIAVINGNIVDISSQVVVGTHIVGIIPEPGTAALLGMGLVGLTLAARRRRG